MLLTGITMLVVSIVYPLERKNGLEIEIKKLEGQNAILDFRAEILDNKLKYLSNDGITQAEKDTLVQKAEEHKLLTIENANHASMISQLNLQYNKFKIWSGLLFYGGLILIGVGLFFWGLLTKLSIKNDGLFSKQVSPGKAE
jgi:hypothetical protein